MDTQRLSFFLALSCLYALLAFISRTIDAAPTTSEAVPSAHHDLLPSNSIGHNLALSTSFPPLSLSSGTRPGWSPRHTPFLSGLQNQSTALPPFLWATRPTSLPSKTQHLQLTTLSDSSTTAVYAYTKLAQYATLTAPATKTLTYAEQASNGQTSTTVGPVFIGGAGLVLLPSPKPKPGPPNVDGITDPGSLALPDPIRPGPPGAKCPSILKFLCSPSHTSDSDGGSDVDPQDESSPPSEEDGDKDNNDDHDKNHSDSDDDNDTESSIKRPSQTITSTSKTSSDTSTTFCGTCSPTTTASSTQTSSGIVTGTQYAIYPTDRKHTAAFQSKLYSAVPSSSVQTAQSRTLGLLWWWTKLTSQQAESLKDPSVTLIIADCSPNINTEEAPAAACTPFNALDSNFQTSVIARGLPRSSVRSAGARNNSYDSALQHFQKRADGNFELQGQVPDEMKVICQPEGTRLADIPGYAYHASAGAGTTIYINRAGSGRVRKYRTAQVSNLSIDLAGHGTRLTSKAKGRRYGIAKNADLVAVKISLLPSEMWESAIEALSWIEEDIYNNNLAGKAFINLSWHLPTPPTDEQRETFQAMLESVIEADAIVVTSAGNTGSTISTYPSRLASEIEDLVVVGAVDNDGTFWQRSNTAPAGGRDYVTYYAPGVNIKSIGPTNNVDTNSGTSQAAVQVTAMFAYLRAANPDYNDIPAADVNKKLKEDLAQYSWARVDGGKKVIYNNVEAAKASDCGPGGARVRKRQDGSFSAEACSLSSSHGTASSTTLASQSLPSLSASNSSAFSASLLSLGTAASSIPTPGTSPETSPTSLSSSLASLSLGTITSPSPSASTNPSPVNAGITTTIQIPVAPSQKPSIVGCPCREN
ncbi:hypothetical protein ACLMJK_008481 [Lecanora helva]